MIGSVIVISAAVSGKNQKEDDFPRFAECPGFHPLKGHPKTQNHFNPLTILP